MKTNAQCKTKAKSKQEITKKKTLKTFNLSATKKKNDQQNERIITNKEFNSKFNAGNSASDIFCCRKQGKVTQERLNLAVECGTALGTKS